MSNQSVLDPSGAAPKKRPEVAIERCKDAPFMPYHPRGCQLDIIQDMVKALSEGKHFVMESGTGTGKTIVSLAGALQYTSDNGKTILYLTRTISQSDQVMKELRSISKIKPVMGLAITGRARSCPLFAMDGREDVSSNVLSLMCDDVRQKSIQGRAGGCRYFDRLDTNFSEIKEYVESQHPTSDDLDKFCINLGACPYEAKKRLMPDCAVIALPYIQIVDPDIRTSLLSNIGCVGNPEAIMLVIDEAHNFIDATREAESFRIDRAMVDAAIDECSTFKVQPKIWEGVLLSDLFTQLKVLIRNVAIEKIPLGSKDSVVIEDPVIEDGLKDKFGMTAMELDTALELAWRIGQQRTDELMKDNQGRISEIETVTMLLRSWTGTASSRFVRTINADAEGEYLRAYCIDPEEVSGFINSTVTVHMSGTLRPMEQYARAIGLSNNCVFRKYPSPFPPENRKVVYTPGLTTNWTMMKNDPSMKQRLETTIAGLCNSVNKNTLVFFTSYSSMESMRGYLSTHINKALYWEMKGKPQTNARNLNTFRSRRDGVLFCVMGGKFAEGIDFPGEELCFAIIVGIPYPPPSPEQSAMSSMFDAKYGSGKGWQYCSAVPAQRKIKQAIGRLIRTETDRGMAVILDERAVRFAKELDASPSSDPVGDAARFFSYRPPDNPFI